MDYGNWLRPILIIVFLAALAVSIRIASHYSDDPYLQPLALTAEGLAAAGEGEEADGFAVIDVEVLWGRDWDGQITRTGLRRIIGQSLKRQTDYLRFSIREMPGNRVTVSFVVGPNRYGPYAPGAMSDGLHAALTAQRMAHRKIE